MALIKAAQAVERKQPGPKCGFGELLRKLDKADLAYYEQMLREERAKTFIADVFRADGYEVSSDKIRRHVNGRCSCR